MADLVPQRGGLAIARGGSLDAELHAALAAFDAAAARREALEDLDEDVLAEAAAEARAFGAGPAAAVDELVRGLLG
ncbi:hypothetical protein [Streptomyces sp. NRRL F-2580]|uniref:hypothetical protein n=1 Tax=Streptomyces sp. NRRL F-2580 TaxID=1463841 RepID=UPI0004CC8F4D|nr:hypothetical protein [Streptomyces sp. NRRL F-2580]